MDTDHEHKRKFQRVPYSGSVTINNSITARCRDISEGGLFIHLTRGMLPGSTVKVAFSTGLSVLAIVQVVSSNGAGLMFTALKPEQKSAIKALVERNIAKAAAPEPGAAAAGPAPAAAAPSNKPSVLIVDDSDSVRRLAKSALTSQGIEVLEANDGVEALKLLSTEVPDLIILDLHMEKMDGYKLLSFRNQIDKLKDIPVIVFSSKFSAEEQEKVFAAGATEFLPKMTTSPVKLAAIVKGHLARKKQ